MDNLTLLTSCKEIGEYLHPDHLWPSSKHQKQMARRLRSNLNERVKSKEISLKRLGAKNKDFISGFPHRYH